MSSLERADRSFSAPQHAARRRARWVARPLTLLGWALVALVASCDGPERAAQGEDAAPGSGVELADAATKDAAYRTLSLDPLRTVQHPWDWVHPTPLGETLRDGWGASAAEWWGVGDAGAVVRNDGGVWTVSYLEGAPDLLAVTVSDVGEVWVAGRGGSLARWDGAQWARVPLPDQRDVWELAWSQGRLLALIADTERKQAVVWSLKPDGWHAESAPGPVGGPYDRFGTNGVGKGVCALSAAGDEVWVAGWGGMASFSDAGGPWTPVPLGETWSPGPAVVGMNVVAPGHVWAVSSDRLYEYLGGAWNQDPWQLSDPRYRTSSGDVEGISTIALRAVAALDANTVVAVGNGEAWSWRRPTEHYDSGWSGGGPPGAHEAVFQMPDGSVRLLGYSGSAWKRASASSAWSAESTPVITRAKELWLSATGAAWVVGGDGTVYRRVGDEAWAKVRVMVPAQGWSHLAGRDSTKGAEVAVVSGGFEHPTGPTVFWRGSDPDSGVAPVTIPGPACSWYGSLVPLPDSGWLVTGGCGAWRLDGSTWVLDSSELGSATARAGSDGMVCVDDTFSLRIRDATGHWTTPFVADQSIWFGSLVSVEADGHGHCLALITSRTSGSRLLIVDPTGVIDDRPGPPSFVGSLELGFVRQIRVGADGRLFALALDTQRRLSWLAVQDGGAWVPLPIPGEPDTLEIDADGRPWLLDGASRIARVRLDSIANALADASDGCAGDPAPAPVPLVTAQVEPYDGLPPYPLESSGPYVGRWEYPRPLGDDFDEVVGPSIDEFWARTRRGLVHYDHGEITRSFLGKWLVGLHRTGPEVWAAVRSSARYYGEGGQVLARWNGDGWTEHAIRLVAAAKFGQDADIRSLTWFDDALYVALGEVGVARFRGGVWEGVPAALGGRAVTTVAVAKGQLYALGTEGLALRLVQGVLEPFGSQGNADFFQASGPDPFFAASQAGSLTLDMGCWEVFGAPGWGATLPGVDSEGGIWATAWTKQPLDNPNRVLSLWAGDHWEPAVAGGTGALRSFGFWSDDAGTLRQYGYGGSLRRLVSAAAGWIDEWPHLLEGAVAGIAFDGGGRAWVLDAGGRLVRDDGAGAWEALSAPPGAARTGLALAVRGIGVDAEAWVLLGTPGVWDGKPRTVAVYREGAWASPPPPTGCPPNDIAASATSGVWLASECGLLRFDGAAWSPAAEALPAVDRVRTSEASNLVAACDDTQVWLWDGAELTTLDPPGGKVFRLALGPDGRVWSSATTVSIWESGSWTQVADSGHWPRNIAVGADGTAWIDHGNTENNELMRFDGQKWAAGVMHTDCERSGTMNVAPDGRPWVGCAYAGVRSFSPPE